MPIYCLVRCEQRLAGFFLTAERILPVGNRDFDLFTLPDGWLIVDGGGQFLGPAQGGIFIGLCYYNHKNLSPPKPADHVRMAHVL